MQLNIKFHAIPSNNFCVGAATKFVWHTHRHFVKIIKPWSGYPKMSKSGKNWKSKIFTIPKFIIQNIEVSKNDNKEVSSCNEFLRSV